MDYLSVTRPPYEPVSRNISFSDIVDSQTSSNDDDIFQITDKIERVDLSMPFEKMVWSDDFYNETEPEATTVISEKFMTKYTYFPFVSSIL